LSKAAANGCSGAAVLRPMPSEARVAFIKTLPQEAMRFPKKIASLRLGIGVAQQRCYNEFAGA